MNKRYNHEDLEKNRRESRPNPSGKLTYLLIGGGVGALLALLFAPKAGQELRSDINDVARKGYDKTLETAQQLKEQSGTYYQQIKEQAGDAYSAAANKIKGAVQQNHDNAEKTFNKQLNVDRGNDNRNVAATYSVSDVDNSMQKAERYTNL